MSLLFDIGVCGFMVSVVVWAFFLMRWIKDTDERFSEMEETCQPNRIGTRY